MVAAVNAGPMIHACERAQVNQITEPTTEELVGAGVSRWGDVRELAWAPDAVYTTWCDRCGCDHGATGV